MLFAGQSRSLLEKTVPLVLSTRPRVKFFLIRPFQPANNIYLLRIKLTQDKYTGTEFSIAAPFKKKKKKKINVIIDR